MNEAPINWYIGFDQKESVSFHVLAHSIMRHATRPIAVIPIHLGNLAGVFSRAPDGKQSNQFSFSRFLVPWLNGFSGYAIWSDCDMLMRTDVSDLVKQVEYGKAVHVVKHDYVPKNSTKYLGATQYQYHRKNWSSMVVWNCAHWRNRCLTPDYVEKEIGMTLHQFRWLDDRYIGELPKEWNHLVGEYDPNPDAKLVHWTVGGPWFHEHENVEYSNDWREELKLMTHSDQIK